MTYIIKIPTAKQRYSTMANSQEAYLGVSKDDRQLKMAPETGNTYISETKRYSQNSNDKSVISDPVEVKNSIDKWV